MEADRRNEEIKQTVKLWMGHTFDLSFDVVVDCFALLAADLLLDAVAAVAAAALLAC